MKTHKLNLSIIGIGVVTLFLVLTISSCGTKPSKEDTAEQTKKGEEAEEHEHEHDSAETKHPDHDETISSKGDAASTMWMPSEQPFSGQLKLIEGDEKMLAPVISSESHGSKVVILTLTGEKVLLLFDGTFENVGANLQFKPEGFQGQLAIVHHYRDAADYDYLSLTNSSMQLGRMESGKNNVLDKKAHNLPNDWSAIRLSAAGEHFKGYFNDKLINHGHAETMAAGRIGLLIEGKGKLALKMMEVVTLAE